jgi:uncharacterized protein (DUF433 family)
MQQLSRITFNPEVMGGKPCIRGLRVTVGTVVGLMAVGHSPEKILQSYPYLELEDIYEALASVDRKHHKLSGKKISRLGGNRFSTA